MTANPDAGRITSWLKRIFAPPQFTDEDKNRTARLLNTILWGTIALLTLRLIFSIQEILRGLNTVDAILTGLVLALFFLLWLMHRGRVRLSAALLIGIAYVGMAYLASTSNERIYDGSFAALSAVSIMAGLLLGWPAALLIIGAQILTAQWLASLFNGEPVALSAATPLYYARDLAIIYTLAGLLLYLLISTLQRALQRSQAIAQDLRQQNLELEQLRGTLEDRVAERTLQLRAAADVGQVAASILNPDQLLSEIAHVIAERFDLYYAAIFTLDHTGSYLVLREATGEAGRLLKERGHRLRVSMDSMVGYAALRQEPRAAMNVSEDTVRFANPLLPDAQSEVALPLIVGREVIGALDVQSVRLNAFDESTLTALQVMASQVAVALQNAQSFQGLQKTVDYTARQYELSRAIFLAKTPDEAYLSLGQVFALFSDIDRIQLQRVVERDANHQPAVYELTIEWDILGGAQMNTGQSSSAAETPLAALVNKNEVVVIRDADEARLPAAALERLAQVNAKAIILAPLMIDAEYSGFVAAVSEQPREFTENEVRLMQSAAEQLGVVLTNLHLAAEMKTTIERVALLNRRLSGEAWDSYRAGRALQRVESGRLEFPAATPENQLQVPIVVRGETIGAFNIADNNFERTWNEEELSLLQTIAGEVSLAIENARLIEQTQRTAQREKDIAVAADQIHRSMNLDTILSTALSEIARITGVENVAIQFGAPTDLQLKSVDGYEKSHS
jgi:GAF domain-containing protein